jgi:hypothetical protein
MEISIFEKGSVPFIDCSEINEQEVQKRFWKEGKKSKSKIYFSYWINQIFDNFCVDSLIIH